MLGKTILMFTDDRAAARTLAGHLRGAGNEVVIADGATAACALASARAVDLAFVDGAATGALDVLDAARGHVPVVVMAAQDPQAMLELVCMRGVEHVLVRTEGEGAIDVLAREVVVTAEKILRGDLFGIEKYLPSFGVELTAVEVCGAADRDEVVEHVSAHAEWLGAGREARRAVAAIVDELVTNAVYDAPRDPITGEARYHGTDRRTKVELDPWEHVTVTWGSDGDFIAISVVDSFGALKPEHVVRGLERCLTSADPIEQKAGGAGLGLYTALSYSSQLVVNVDRGARTEIIAIVDLRRRNAGARRAGRSLHLFFDDSSAIPQAVEVSDSMLVEMREALAPSKHQAPVIPLTRRKSAA